VHEDLMKALFLTHNLPERGSYFRAHEIARRLASRGHEVHFGFISEHKKYRPLVRDEAVGHGTLRYIEYPRFTLVNDRQEGWGLFDNFWRVWHVLRGDFDFVYGFSHKPDCILPSLLARPACPRFVLDWSDWWSGPEGLYQACVVPSAGFRALPRPIRAVRRLVFAAEQSWEPRVWRMADAVTLISSEFFRHPVVDRGELQEKAWVMHSGAPLDTIQPMDKIEARRACGLEFPADATVFGYVASFHTDERLLLQAFARVLAELPQAYLVVVGSEFEVVTPELHAATRGHVIHLGRQPFDRMGHYLGAADILLLPLSNIALNRARYPHKLSDYVAAGRPIVACDVGETGRLLRRYRIGFLTEPTAYGLSKGMMAAVGMRAQWPQLGDEVRAAAERYFSWDRLCDGLFDFLSRRLKLDFGTAPPASAAAGD
jgi:glycosyltransferase involved in cell wall biosynthesis